MKEYIKPIIEEEEVFIEDICISSSDSADADYSNGDSIM